LKQTILSYQNAGDFAALASAKISELDAGPLVRQYFGG
jgi:hypothetical protein